MTNETTPTTAAGGSPLKRGVGRPVPKRALPADVARCSGVEDDDGTWREGCADCLRRTDRSYFPQAAWMAPPALVVFECEARIEP
jgi:hypothetical protein